MNIPRPLIPTIDVIAVQTRVQVGDKSVRRMVNVDELVGLDPTTKDVLTNDVFKWNPKSDTIVFYGRSYVLENIMKRHGFKHEEVMEEFFFSSRRRHTIFDCDWSSDVCSSD